MTCTGHYNKQTEVNQQWPPTTVLRSEQWKEYLAVFPPQELSPGTRNFGVVLAVFMWQDGLWWKSVPPPQLVSLVFILPVRFMIGLWGFVVANRVRRRKLKLERMLRSRETRSTKRSSLQSVARWRSWTVQYVLDPVTRECALVKSSHLDLYIAFNNLDCFKAALI